MVNVAFNTIYLRNNVQSMVAEFELGLVRCNRVSGI